MTNWTEKTASLAVFAGYTAILAWLFRDVIFGGRIFPTDYQLSQFYADLSLWSDSWLAGYYIAADPNAFHFYPLRTLFKGLFASPLDFNLFIFSAYIISSSFTFLYLRALKFDIWLAFLGGLFFTLGGFMIGHLGHTGMIHTAAWLPAILWSLEIGKASQAHQWRFFYVVAVVMMFLAGHTQILVYSMMVAGLYVLMTGPFAKRGFFPYFRDVLLLTILAVGLSSFQILPTVDLVSESFRSELNFEDFTSYAHSFSSLMLAVFPHAYGNVFFNGQEYFGPYNPSELAVHIGFVACIAFVLSLFWIKKLSKIELFWLLISLVSLSLMLGQSVPWLAELTFQVPLLNLFRAPARHSLEFGFSIAVITTTVLARLTASDPGAATRWVVASTVLIISLPLLILYFKYPDIERIVGQTAAAASRHAILVAAVVAVSTATLLILAMRSRLSIRRPLVFLASFISIMHFANYGDFRRAYSQDILKPRSELVDVITEIKESDSRVLSLEGHSNRPLNPMLSALYGLKSIDWYGPMIPRDFSQVTGMQVSGWVSPSILDFPKFLAMMNVQFVFTNTTVASRALTAKVGTKCGGVYEAKQVARLSETYGPGELEIVSSLGCSTNIFNGQAVAEITLRNSSGEFQSIIMRAGEDSSEWAHECVDVNPFIKHGKSRVYSSELVRRDSTPDCSVHTYVTTKKVELDDFDAFEINWNSDIYPGVISIREIFHLAGSARKVVHESIEPKFVIYRNLSNGYVLSNPENARSAWISKRVIDQESAGTDIRKDIENLDSYTDVSYADLAGPGKDWSENFDDQYHIEQLITSGSHKSYDVKTTSGGLLVFSIRNHRGWSARVNGKKVKLFRVNGLLQGVFIDPGHHAIDLYFRPQSFTSGLFITAATIALILGLLVSGQIRRLRRIAKTS